MSLARHSARIACIQATVIGSFVFAQGVGAQRTDVSLPNPRQSFDDSWFWGVKGGAVRFGTVVDGRVTAPTAGAEWLITREHGALLVSGEQIFFNRTSSVVDPYSSTGARDVSIKDARRYSAAALATPMSFGRFRPYAGVGLGLNVIRNATAMGSFSNEEQYATVADRIDAGQSNVTAFLIAGAQAQIGRFAIFAQANTASGQQRSLWNLGGASQIEGGIRYNLSSAFEH